MRKSIETTYMKAKLSHKQKKTELCEWLNLVMIFVALISPNHNNRCECGGDDGWRGENKSLNKLLSN